MKIRFKLLCSLCLFPILLSSQEVQRPDKEVIPPSPTVANLMAFEEVPIDYYTGQPNIAIPIYNKAIGGAGNLTVALKYNTQGVKIQSRSSWVGTGWSLDAGGVVSRTVRGIPDEEPDDSDVMLGIFHNADFWGYGSLTATEKLEFQWKTNGSSLDRYDTEHDLFQFSLLGFSGRFIVTKQGSSLVPKLINIDQNVEIDLNYNSTTYEINSFTITDPFGFKYLFDEKEITEAQPISSSQLQTQGALVEISASGAAATYSYTSAWHLSSIKTSNNVELVSFDYSEEEESYTVSKNITQNHIVSPPGGSVSPDFLANGYNGSQLKPRQVSSHFTNTTDTQKLSKITFRDGTSLNFETTTGHPETNGVILDKIIIKDDDNTEIKRFTFNTEETTSNDRLWLTSLDETAGGETLTHTFNYTDKGSLPDFEGYSDAWGNIANLSTNGLPVAYDADLIKTGLLESIDFPTGGRKEFVFEQHTFSYGAGDGLSNDQYWENPENFSLETNNITFSGSYDLGTSSGEFSTTLLDIDFDQTVYLEVDLEGSQAVGGGGGSDPYLGQTQESGDPFDPVNNMVFKVEDDQNNVVALVPMRNQAFITSFPLEEGSYTYIIESPTTGNWNLDGHVKLHYKEAESSLTSKFLLGGGPRIKEIKFYAKTPSATPDRTWEYSYRDTLDNSKSSGAVDALLGNLTRTYRVQVSKYLFGGSENVAGSFEPKTISYEVISQGANAQMTKGGYVGYKTVAVKESGNGRTVYSYTNPEHFSQPSGVFTYPYDPPQNIDYKRGRLLKMQVFNEAGQVLKETFNTYDYDFNLLSENVATSKILVNPESCVWSQFYDAFSNFLSKTPETERIPLCGGFNCFSSTPFQNCGGSPGFYFKEESIGSNWAVLTESIERSYFYDGSTQTFNTVTQTFDYNDQNFQQSEVIRTLEENAQEVTYKTLLYYPVGGYPSSEYTSAEQGHISAMSGLHNINTPVFTKQYKGTTLLSSVQSIFYEYETDLVSVKEIKAAKGSNSLESRYIIHDYDTYGNILEVSQTGGTLTSYIWGYNGTRPVIQAQNVGQSNLAAAVSWAVTNMSSPPTGVTDLDDLLVYVEDMTTSGQKQAWANFLSKLREHSNMAYAQATALTYHPVYGTTSQTAPNGITTYYEYDNFGRLQFVRDRDGNILKMNEYEYKVYANATGN